MRRERSHWRFLSFFLLLLPPSAVGPCINVWLLFTPRSCSASFAAPISCRVQEQRALISPSGESERRSWLALEKERGRRWKVFVRWPPPLQLLFTFLTTSSTPPPKNSTGKENELKAGDVIRCRECGYRILYKKRTKRVVQFEAR